MYYYFLFRKIVFSLLILVGIGVIVLLVRFFWEGPEDQPVTKIPIQSPTQQASKGPSIFLEKKIDILKTEGPSEKMESKPLKPPGESEKQVAAAPPSPTESKPAGPPSTPAGKPSPPVPKTEARSSVSLPLQEIKKEPPLRESKKERKSRESALKNKVTSPDSPKSEPSDNLQTDQKTATIKAGGSIYALAEEKYRVSNTSVVDRIMETNPKITDPNQLPANLKIRLPEITEESLIIPSSDSSVTIRLGSFMKPEYANFLKSQPALQGKEIQITSWKTPSGQIFYRVTAGKFDNREEGLQVIRDLKEKGLSPYFEGFKKKN